MKKFDGLLGTPASSASRENDDVSEHLPDGFIWLKDVATKGMAAFLEEAKGGFRRINQTQDQTFPRKTSFIPWE